MRIQITTLLFVTAIGFGCGGNNPIPSQGMTNSGTTADANIHSPVYPMVSKKDYVDQSVNNNRSNVVQENITPKDDFTNADIAEIESPAQQYDVPKEHYEIQAEAGGTIRYEKTGSTIQIPPDALVDKNGKLVQGDVDISYREFHTQKEIFFSGIPMDYDVNGEKCFFESAGMIDISASQNGEEVFIKKGKQIRFKMSTDNTHEEVKLYELDKNKKKWTESGEAPVINTPTKVSASKKVWSPIYRTEQEKKTQYGHVYLNIVNATTEKDPLTNKKEKYLLFNISVNRLYQSMVKENEQVYKDSRLFSKFSFLLKGMNKKQFRKMMRDLKMPAKTTRDRFAVTEETKIDFVDAEFPKKLTIRFTYNGNQVDVPVDLNYSYNMSKKTKTKWFNKLTAFDMNTFPWRTKEVIQNKQVVDHYDSLDVDAIWMNKSLVQREFTSKSFGILNCDQPQKLPTGMIANAAFNADGQEISPYDVTLVDFDKNTMFTYYNYMFPKFQFNPDTKNFVFTVLNDGRIAFMLPDEFTQIQQNGDMNFNLHIITIENFEKVMEELFPSKNETSYQI